MADEAPASATSSAASGGGTPAKTPVPWLRPGVALIIGGLLTAGTAWLLWWVAAADPAGGCGGRGVVALTLAGSETRAEEILTCAAFTPDAVRSSIARDVALIAAYALTLSFWCAYGGLRARRRPTRWALYGLIWPVVLAVVLDGAENLLLGSIFDGPGKVTTVPSPQVHWLFGLALAKLVLLAAPVGAAFVILLGNIARVARTAWGSDARPVFTGSSSGISEPRRRPSILVEAPRSREAAMRRRPPGSPPQAGTDDELDPDDPWPVEGLGICVSGGGIRAASVTIGALQSLVEHGIYQEARYLASVSGGGYAAGAAQILARQEQEHPVLLDGDRKIRPPFDPGGDRGDAAPETEWVSSRARFLWPPVEIGRVPSTRAFLRSSSFALRGILFNLGLVLALVYVVVVPVGWLVRLLYSEPGPNPSQEVTRTTFVGGWIGLGLILLGLGPHIGAFLWSFLGRFNVAEQKSGAVTRGKVPRIILVTVLTVASMLVVGLLLRYGLPASAWWSSRTVWARILLIGAGVVVAVLLAYFVDRVLFKAAPAFVILLGLVALAAHWLEDAINQGWSGDTSWRVALTILAVLAGVVVFLVVAAGFRLLVRRRHPAVFGFLLVLSVAAGLTSGVVLGDALVGAANTNTLAPAWVTYVVVVAFVVAVYALLDQKRWSPHPVYKRRLASTFSPVRSRILDPKDGQLRVTASQLPFATPTTMSEWMQPIKGHPQLLICAAVYDTLRSNGSVRSFPFVFSSDYVGGADVGWARTLDFEATLGRSNSSDGTLLAAMAISGAAVSAGFGQINLGTLNIVLALLNARLGVWLPSPTYVNELRNFDGEWRSPEGPALRWIRVRRASYLIKEVLGIHDRDDRFIYVTDGGQFDNLGLIELLSRRCRLIICIDSSGDGVLSTTAFDEVRQLAHDRYGIHFSLPGKPWDPECPKVGTCADGEPTLIQRGLLTTALVEPVDVTGAASPVWPHLSRRMAQGNVADLEVHYPVEADGRRPRTGHLIFAKAVLTAETPNDVLSFALSSKRFPHNSTADQFLEPDQVSNYVRLGRDLGSQAAALARRHPPLRPS